jgi:hypothetical protein
VNYGNWTKSWDLLQFDWLRCIAWNLQSSKSKELISFLYTSTTYCILERFVLSPWSLSCAMDKHSYRVAIYYPYPRGKHSKESLLPIQGSYSLWYLSACQLGIRTKRKMPDSPTCRPEIICFPWPNSVLPSSATNPASPPHFILDIEKCQDQEMKGMLHRGKA